jgi:hypothetical protein
VSETTSGTFADNTAIFATHEDPTIASIFKSAYTSSKNGYRNGKFRLTNPSHNVYPWKGHCPAVNINQAIIRVPQTEAVTYRRTTLRLQVKLKRTHRQKKKTNRLKNKRDQLVNRGKNPIYL